ncbi:MAG TPA: type IV pilus assembly protein PilM [Candidatus Binatia bacterium]|nr:type IV pilus assembly protein PilM [Candidatus Binatia bacterium]
MAGSVDWRKRLSRLLTVSLSDLNPLKRDEQYVSIDIGSSSVKIVEVRAGSSGLHVTSAGSLPVPSSAIQSNMVSDPSAVAEVLRTLVESHGIRGNKAITAVPGPAVIIKRVTLPTQDAQELENTIMFEAGNFIPEDLENVNLDYQITDYLEDGKRMDVLLVAAKKDIVSSYAETVRAAGLAPIVVDVDYFALENMFELNYEPEPGQVIALVNVGARYSSINILKGGRSTFTGDVPVGGRDITDALVRDLGVEVEVAERLKAGETVAGIDPEQVSVAMGPAADTLIEEIHHALSFFWTAATDEAINCVYLSGGSSQMPEFGERLSQRIEVPVSIADPLTRVTVASNLEAAGLRQHAPEYAVAMGLAVRRPDDK